MEIAQLVLEIAQLVLEYIKVLVWPLIALFVVVKYDKYFIKILKRVAEESEELSTSIFGLEMSTKFREQMSALAAQPGTEKDLRESLEQKVQDFTRDQFRVVSTYFYDAPLHVRRKAAAEIASIAADLELEDLLQFAKSSLPGERVSAGIGLRVKIQSNKSFAEDQRVIDVLEDLLRDTRSRVRYRAAKAISASPELVSRFREDLEDISRSDDNSAVREAAKRALR